jgi:hypothetical protein
VSLTRTRDVSLVPVGDNNWDYKYQQRLDAGAAGYNTFSPSWCLQLGLKVPSEPGLKVSYPAGKIRPLWTEALVPVQTRPGLMQRMKGHFSTSDGLQQEGLMMLEKRICHDMNYA